MAGCAPVYFEPISFPSFSAFSFIRQENILTGGDCADPSAMGFKGEQWCYHGARTPLGDVNRSQRFPIGMILHAGWREKAAGPSNAFHHHHPKGPLLEPYFDT